MSKQAEHTNISNRFQVVEVLEELQPLSLDALVKYTGLPRDAVWSEVANLMANGTIQRAHLENVDTFEFVGQDSEAEVKQALVDALTESASLIGQYIRDAGPCDHSVGICVCGDIAILEQAQAALKLARGE